MARRLADGSSIVPSSRAARQTAAPRPDHVPDEVLIILASSVSEETVDALGRRLRLNRVASFTANDITMFRWKILDRRPVPAVVRSLEAESIVLAAQPNYTYQLAGAARPPSFGGPGRTRLSLNGSKPSISPEASGVDRDGRLRR